jgi:hypothetical protein
MTRKKGAAAAAQKFSAVVCCDRVLQADWDTIGTLVGNAPLFGANTS